MQIYWTDSLVIYLWVRKGAEYQEGLEKILLVFILMLCFGIAPVAASAVPGFSSIMLSTEHVENNLVFLFIDICI